MLGSRGTRVRFAIAAAAALFATTLFLAGDDVPPNAAIQHDTPERSIDAAVSARASAGLGRGELPTTAAETLDSRVAASDGEPLRPSETPSSLPLWVRDALEVDDDAAGRLLTNRDPLFTGAGLDPRHLAVLADIIAASELSEASSPFDYDNGNGILEPWELGYQVWENGSLVLLGMGPSSNFSFGYQGLALPDSIGDLTAVRVLALDGSGLDRLPDSIGSLESLREFWLHDNRLSELPRSIGYLWQLRELHLAGNDVSFLPSELGSLDLLERLNASDNPLEFIEDGALGLPLLRVLSLERTPRPQAPGTHTWGQLRELPDELATLSLEELRVGGNLLYCVGGSPASHLTDGSITSVVGLGSQRCGSI